MKQLLFKPTHTVFACTLLVCSLVFAILANAQGDDLTTPTGRTATEILASIGLSLPLEKAMLKV